MIQITRSCRVPDARERLDAWPAGTYRQLREHDPPLPPRFPFTDDRGPDAFDDAMTRYLEGYSERSPNPADF